MLDVYQEQFFRKQSSLDVKLAYKDHLVAEVKKMWSCTYTSPFVFMKRYVITHKD